MPEFHDRRTGKVHNIEFKVEGNHGPDYAQQLHDLSVDTRNHVNDFFKRAEAGQLKEGEGIFNPDLASRREALENHILEMNPRMAADDAINLNYDSPSHITKVMSDMAEIDKVAGK